MPNGMNPPVPLIGPATPAVKLPAWHLNSSTMMASTGMRSSTT